MITDRTEQGIARSLLRVLRGWPDRRPATVGPSSRLVFRREHRAPRNGLRWQDVRDLARDQVLIDDWVGDGDAIAVTGADQNAISSFCDEAFAAWERLQAKLAGSGRMAA